MSKLHKILDRYGTYLRIWDDGGKSFDRYTILPPRWAKNYRERSRLWNGIGASENPFHPQGFGQWITALPGKHLGTRITWNTLPEEVKEYARQSFPEFAPGES